MNNSKLFLIIFCVLFLFPGNGETHWDGTHQTMADLVSVTFTNDGKQQYSDFLQQNAPDKGRPYLDLLKQGVRDADLRVNGIYAVDKKCRDITKSSCPESEKVANDIPEWIVGDHCFHSKTLKGYHSLPGPINRVYIDWGGWTEDAKIRETLIAVLPGKTFEEKKNALINIMKEANAAKLAEFFYSRALAEWRNNHPGDAFYNLGIALHVVQDLTVPHHSKLIINGGNYEQYVQEIYLKSVKGASKIPGLYLRKSPMDWIKTIAEKSYEWSTDPKVSAGDSFSLGVSATAGFVMNFFNAAAIPVKKDSEFYPVDERTITLSGHTNAVNSVDFSPDGKTIVTGGADKSINIWEVGSGKLERKLIGHTDPVHSIRISPNGNTIASGSGGAFDYTARLWDKNSGRLLHTFNLGGIVFSLVFSPDGKFLASAAWDIISIHEVASGKRIIQFPWSSKHTAVNSIVFSSDGKMLFSAHDEGFIKMWDVDKRILIATLPGHSSKVSSLAVGINNLLVSGSADKKIIIWDTNIKKPLHTLIGHTGYITSVDINQSIRMLASGDTRGVIIF